MYIYISLYPFKNYLIAILMKELNFNNNYTETYLSYWIYKFIFKQRYSISIFSCLKDLWTKRDRAKILVEWEQREIVFECRTSSKYTSLTYQIQILKILKRLQLNRLIKSKSFILNVLQRGNFQFNGIVVTTVTDFWAFWIIICNSC